MNSPSPDIHLRFGIISDIHYSPENAGQEEEVATALGRCLDDWEAQDVAFVLQLGDLISREGPEAEADLIAVTAMLAGAPALRFEHVPGNHCLSVGHERFFSLMGIPPWRTFSAGGIRFVVLHGMEVSTAAEPDDPADRHLLDWHHGVQRQPFYCGAVGSRQMAWLRETLDDALRQGEPVIAVSHLPLLEASSDERHGLLWNHEAVSGLLLRYPNVRACLCGHYHPGSYALRSGTHFVVVPGFVTRREHPAFMAGTVEISGGRMRILGTGGTPLHDLAFG